MSDVYTLADAQSMNWPILLTTAENGRFPSVALNRPVCVVGARCLVHFPLPAQTISKAQALIVCETGGVYIRDLASRNQTFIDNQPIRESWLNPSNLLRFGPFTFECHTGFDRASEPASAPAAELWLQPDGLASRQVVSLKQRTFLIGSRLGCDLLLEGDEIALAHAAIFARDGRRYLRDLSTFAGSFVNGNRIREVELNSGDEIRVGDSRIEYYPIEPRVLANESDGTVMAFTDDGESIEMANESPVEVGNVSFEIPTADEPHHPEQAPHVATADQIILPWDDPAPMELELVDSHVGH